MLKILKVYYIAETIPDLTWKESQIGLEWKSYILEKQTSKSWTSYVLK